MLIEKINYAVLMGSPEVLEEDPVEDVEPEEDENEEDADVDEEEEEEDDLPMDNSDWES